MKLPYGDANQWSEVRKTNVAGAEVIRRAAEDEGRRAVEDVVPNERRTILEPRPEDDREAEQEYRAIHHGEKSASGGVLLVEYPERLHECCRGTDEACAPGADRGRRRGVVRPVFFLLITGSDNNDFRLIALGNRALANIVGLIHYLLGYNVRGYRTIRLTSSMKKKQNTSATPLIITHQYITQCQPWPS